MDKVLVFTNSYSKKMTLTYLLTYLLTYILTYSNEQSPS